MAAILLTGCGNQNEAASNAVIIPQTYFKAQLDEARAYLDKCKKLKHESPAKEFEWLSSNHGISCQNAAIAIDETEREQRMAKYKAVQEESLKSLDGVEIPKNYDLGKYVPKD